MTLDPKRGVRFTPFRSVWLREYFLARVGKLLTEAMKDIIAKVSPAFSKAAGSRGSAHGRLRSKRNNPQNPSARGEFKNSPVDCF